MYIFKITSTFLISILLYNSCQNGSDESVNGDVRVRIETTEGDITLKLYNETPLHRDNFIELANNNFYDSILFHRVINEFMIQTGDPTSKFPIKGEVYGMEDVGYKIHAEIVPEYYHKRGAIGAARQGDDNNPDRLSSGSQFYIVTGKVHSERDLQRMFNRRNENLKQKLFNDLVMKRADELYEQGKNPDFSKIPEEINSLFIEKWDTIQKYELTKDMIDTYSTIGGAPHLDGEYTVFGEVIDGFEVIDRISNSETNQSGRPIKNISIITVELIN